MRAILLASATATTLKGRRARSCVSQGYFPGFSWARRNTAMSDLSWLNPTPHAIAVYASQPLSPVATQHSLPSGRYSLLGPDFHRLDRTSFAWRTHSITLSARIRNVSGMILKSGPRSYYFKTIVPDENNCDVPVLLPFEEFS